MTLEFAPLLEFTFPLPHLSTKFTSIALPIHRRPHVDARPFILYFTAVFVPGLQRIHPIYRQDHPSDSPPKTISLTPHITTKIPTKSPSRRSTSLPNSCEVPTESTSRLGVNPDCAQLHGPAPHRVRPPIAQDAPATPPLPLPLLRDSSALSLEPHSRQVDLQSTLTKPSQPGPLALLVAPLCRNSPADNMLLIHYNT